MVIAGTSLIIGQVSITTDSRDEIYEKIFHFLRCTSVHLYICSSVHCLSVSFLLSYSLAILPLHSLFSPPPLSPSLISFLSLCLSISACITLYQSLFIISCFILFPFLILFLHSACLYMRIHVCLSGCVRANNSCSVMYSIQGYIFQIY